MLGDKLCAFANATCIQYSAHDFCILQLQAGGLHTGLRAHTHIDRLLSCDKFTYLRSF